ncbi:hypothetical protein [Chamaesiphon sp. OTE_75_metabat_556]|uniref:hypothetical protein n=1 Tax=Chamaesiphon sp. OTE_75_metabat_556 TaxID=2964692 RepID=UPI00286D1E7E|nr:hypothetical protein [Chamaesiphon sp. OTE_75_metabat_556]
MTIINQSELNQLRYLDQALMWAIMSINNSNLDSRNNYISDNAAVRAESKDYITWSVTQDDNGAGRFVFSALLPIVNPHPLEDKQSILERIWSYSPYDPSMTIDVGMDGYGWPMPDRPTWCDSTERLLAYLAVIASKLTSYRNLTKFTAEELALVHYEYWGECQYIMSDTPYGGTMTIAGYLTIDWNSYLQGKSLIKCLNPYSAHASDINCNFPDLVQLWSVPSVDLDLPAAEITDLIPSTGEYSVIDGTEVSSQTTTADSLIRSYGQTTYIAEYANNLFGGALGTYLSAADAVNNTSAGLGSSTPKLIESITTCKEQDPDLASYATTLADKVNVK